ncbi:hypothetical protein Tco_0871935 [Tanacetum coccineum]
MADYPFDERYILVPRKMSPLKAKQPKKPPPKRTRNVGKSKHAQLTTSSSFDSPPLENGDLPSTKLSLRSYSRALLNLTNMAQDQRETRGMFKNLARAAQVCKYIKEEMSLKGALLVKQFTCLIIRETTRISVNHSNFVNLDSSSEEHQNEKTPSPPPRKKSLSPPQAPSKFISSKSTHYTSSSSLSESLTPTHVAPPPKLCFFIPLKLEPQELPPLTSLPNNPFVSTMEN